MYFSDISNACEDHIEVGDVLEEFDFSITDLDTASHAVTDYAVARLEAIAKGHPKPLSLMVSGGVDSLHMLASAVKAGIDVVAYTFSWPGSEKAEQELATAKAVCDALGVVHVPVRPTDREMEKMLAGVTQKLQTSEPWEVLSGVVLYALADRIPEDSAIISAAGADTLLRGGKEFAPSRAESDTLGRWEAQVKSDIRRGFTRHRFIPDFHKRVLGERSERYFKLWQTRQAVDLAGHLHPQVVRGESWNADKLVIRNAARQIGVSAKYTLADKEPMQVSSGGVSAIEKLVRGELAHQFRGRTYSNPETEDIEFVLARLYLDRLWARAAAWPAHRI